MASIHFGQPHVKEAALTSTTTCKHQWWWPICELRILLNDTCCDLASFQAVFQLQNQPI